MRTFYNHNQLVDNRHKTICNMINTQKRYSKATVSLHIVTMMITHPIKSLF